jgi:hypothetical protein
MKRNMSGGDIDEKNDIADTIISSKDKLRCIIKKRLYHNMLKE